MWFVCARNAAFLRVLNRSFHTDSHIFSCCTKGADALGLQDITLTLGHIENI